ncbi:unnamed protein product [Clonostachys rosea f. rosea IK726]|uniref:Uncharacterized protein n=1 Tax=Clonostachys rosea f. rosea IK726 TaxID=1349383 RepID=A0ACA9TLE6_BIOOC|nr:unnamed protein product [Clonostachys rosea f. rosea IK726]
MPAEDVESRRLLAGSDITSQHDPYAGSQFYAQPPIDYPPTPGFPGAPGHPSGPAPGYAPGQGHDMYGPTAESGNHLAPVATLPGYTPVINPAAGPQKPGDGAATSANRFRLRLTNALRIKMNWRDILSRKWAVAFICIVALQAVICLTFETYIYLKIKSNLKSDIRNDFQKQINVIPTFLPLFYFGFVYQNILVWDSLRAKNTIQIIGVCFANLALVVYTAVQVDQTRTSLKDMEDDKDRELADGVDDEVVFASIRALLFTTPVLLTVGTMGIALCTWQLYKVFAWDTLKVVGADYKMKKRYMYHQIYIALLKIDFFFWMAFIIQLVSSTPSNDVEFALSIAAIPVTIGIIVLAAFSAKRENIWGMVITIILYFGGLSYFAYKTYRIGSDAETWYLYMKKPLITFAVLTIVMILVTIVIAIIVITGFGKGLKNYFETPTSDEEGDGKDAFNMTGTGNNRHSRITID